MVWQETPWADPLLASTVVSASLAVFGILYVGFVRRDRRVLAFATLMVGAALWTLGYSFQFASATLDGKVQWATVSLIGEAIVPTAWLVFTLTYARRDEWLSPTVLSVLAIFPALTVLLAVTNGYHGLVWKTLTLDNAPDGAYVVLESTAGPWLWVHGAYSYLAAFAGVVVIVGLIERSRHVYRGQALVLFGGILTLVSAHLLSVLAIGPAEVVDLTSPSLSVLGIAFAIGIFRYRMFDLVPVARSTIVENMGEGYVLLDETETVVDRNATAGVLLDGNDGQLIGRDVREVFDVNLNVLDAFEGEPVTETITRETATGTQYLELTVSAIQTNSVWGQLLKVRDVTDRMQLERRFQTLIERSSDLVFVLDESGLFEYVSPSVNEVLGYQPENLLGTSSFDDLVVDASEKTESHSTAPSTRSVSKETWSELAADDAVTRLDDETVRFEVCLESRSGNPRIVEVLARNLLEDVAVEGIVINARDVTERTERERELQRTNERLDRFAQMVSHDLRNPLNAAQGFLDLARQTDDEAQLDRVERSHTRMEQMIEDLLTMARAETAIEETEPVDLDSLVADAWKTAVTDEATLDVTFEENFTVEADRGLLRNVFENLFRNAVDHNDLPLTVRVGTLSGTDSSPVGFFVEDDGVGIPREQRESVFEHGYTTVENGTGFGLSIVSEFVEAHGWEITVTESTTGGARFEIRVEDGLSSSDQATNHWNNTAEQITTERE